MTPLDLAAIRARTNAATPGPWQAAVSASDDKHWIVLKAHEPTSPRVAVCTTRFSPPEGRPGEQEDAAFIAGARSDVPALCDELERHRALLRDIEWEGPSGRCPSCPGGRYDGGHAHDCALAALLGVGA